MPCAYPQPGWRKVYKHGNIKGVYLKEPCMRPCGQCLQCRLEKARQWAMRCIHESQMHEENCFVTLTYNDQNLPADRSVHKLELSNFMRRLRKKLNGKEIKFYGCGEYGDRLGRPHYHVCLFGHEFNDKEVIQANRIKYFKNRFSTAEGHSLYTSPFLEKVWGKGFVTVGDLTFESAGYVARYVMKKITGKKASAHYKNKSPEFCLMSRNPGIGFSWFEKFKSDAFPKDFTTVKGAKMKPPTYYDYLLEKSDPTMFNEVKIKRQDFVDPDKLDPKKNIEKRLRLERVKKQQTRTLLRKLHNAET